MGSRDRGNYRLGRQENALDTINGDHVQAKLGFISHGSDGIKVEGFVLCFQSTIYLSYHKNHDRTTTGPQFYRERVMTGF